VRLGERARQVQPQAGALVALARDERLEEITPHLLGHAGAVVFDDDLGPLTAAPRASDPSTWGKVSRNAQCPCGSGKKYKHCHGKAF